ncbi:hypothetical protein VTO42DRAFT_700 [Malbranchea cinnamomea]
MAPPGRRRLFRCGSILYLFATIFILVLVVSFPSSASAAGSGVIGIDLGTEYLKAALVKPGIPLEIVLTKDSKRKETAAVAFKPSRDTSAAFPERFYGGDAVALAPRFPDDVYANLKPLLGVSLDTGVQGGDLGDQQNVVAIYKERYPAVKISDVPGNRGTVGFKSDRLGKEEGQAPFLVEELLAMQLQQVKANAEAMAGPHSIIQDAVITFPAFYTAEEKRSVKLAAELAGLNVIAMISDGLAVGTYYATSRSFPSVTDGKTPEYHVVFDMGAGSTTATVLKFQSRTVKDIGKFNKTVQEVQVVGAAWDRTLGGDALNQLITNDMIDKLLESKELDGSVTAEQVKSHGKTMAKLWKESERLRHILSANTEMSVSVEGLYSEDVNFKYALTRSSFEDLAKEHAKRVSVPLMEALSSAQLSLDDIGSIILHGGATRTPFVQRELEAACKDSKKLRTSVNADEAAAFGAAFKGAALSPSFKVKEIRTWDTPGYAVAVKWQSADKDRQQKVFTPQSDVGVEKLLTLKNLEDFDFRFYQQNTRGGNLVEAPIMSVKTTNLTASVTKLKDEFNCAPANITTQLTIRLSSLDGLPEVVAGTVNCEVVEKKGVVEDVKEFLGLGSKKPDQQPLNEEAAPKPIDLDSTSPSVENSPVDGAASAAATEEPGKPKDVKTRIESTPIGFTVTPLGIPLPSAEDLRRIKGRLATFDASDLARVQREETFNNLESFIYRTRDLVNDEGFIKAIPKQALTALEERLSAADEWLYGDGINAGTQDIKAKLTGLKELVDPVLNRQKEHSLRPLKLRTLKQSLTSAKTFLEVLDSQLKAEKSLSSAAASDTESETATESGPSPMPSSPSESVPDGSASEEGTDSTSTTSSPSATPSSSISSIFTVEELTSLAFAFNDINNWLESQVEKQEKLSDWEDPILTIAQLDSKARQLDEALNKIMSKMTKHGEWEKAGGKKGKKGKTEKSGKNEEKPVNGKAEKEDSKKEEGAKRSKEGHDEL